MNDPIRVLHALALLSFIFACWAYAVPRLGKRKG